MQEVKGTGVVATLVKPAPAQMSGPRVISTAPPVYRGEVDARALGNRIDPQRYAQTLKLAEERAKQRPRR